ncbi:MAG: hypothetical protein AAGA50_19930 [Pseudomonadota bacterium]
MRLVITAFAVALVLGVTGTGFAQSDPAAQPINCSTAEGDIRALNSEKEYARRQQVRDVTAIIPAGALLGIVTGTERKKLQMLSGEYVRKIDGRIAEIKRQCGL